MNKLLSMKEFQFKELLLIIMQLRLKLNTFLEKLNKLLSNISLLKEHMKEFNISLSKLKLFIIPKEKNMLDMVATTLEEATSLAEEAMLSAEVSMFQEETLT